MTMPMKRIRDSAPVARLVPLALLVPFLAFAQAPAQPAPAQAAPVAAPPAQAAPAAAPTEAPKDAAPDAAAKDAAPADGKARPSKSASERFPAPPGVGDTPPATGPLAPLAWLTGCWWGDVNKHEFREYWHPLRGDMMIGVSRMALPDKVSSYEYLRLESRADGIYYVAAQKGKAESAFKLTKAGKDRADEVFTFSVEGTGFPTSITYRRGSGGWLYVEVAGVAQGRDHKVTYPFRRVSCETGEFIRK